MRKMRTLTELVKYGCWLVGAVGIIGVYALYSIPAHLSFDELFLIAAVSLAFLIVGFVIRAQQKPTL